MLGLQRKLNIHKCLENKAVKIPDKVQAFQTYKMKKYSINYAILHFMFSTMGSLVCSWLAQSHKTFLLSCVSTLS